MASNSFDEYVSDPAKPVPYIGYTAIDRTIEYMDDDQRFAATRPDVLVYQTDVLKEDVTLAGPLSARLHVSTTGTDSDFVVKLIDVYSADFPNPDPNPTGVQMGGYQQLVRGERCAANSATASRSRSRSSPAKTTAVELDDARHLPHVPPRPPHHDPGPKLVVPAGRPQPANVLRHLHGHRGRLSKGDAARLPFAAGRFATARGRAEPGNKQSN